MLGLVFFGVAFGGCLRSLSGLPVLGRVLGCTQAMADGKPKGLNKMPAPCEGRPTSRRALLRLQIFSDRLPYAASVCSLRTWTVALLLIVGISTAGSSLGTPGLAHPIGASRLDYASPRQTIWAHNTSGSLLLRRPRLRRQQLRASSSEGQPLQTFQGFGRLIIAGARVTLTPLAKQLFRMQRDLTPGSTYTFAATGIRYAFPDMLLPESLSCSCPKLLAPESPSGSLTLRSQFVDRLLWTPWTRLVSGCIWQVRRPFGIKRLCACICASGSSLRAIGKACTECAAAFHSALVHHTVVCANFLPFVIGRAPCCLSSTACHPVRPRFEATSPGAQSLLSLTQLVLQPRFEATSPQPLPP